MEMDFPYLYMHIYYLIRAFALRLRKQINAGQIHNYYPFTQPLYYWGKILLISMGRGWGYKFFVVSSVHKKS